MNDQHRAALAQAMERGPTPYLDGVVRWRLCVLAQWLWEEFRVSASSSLFIIQFAPEVGRRGAPLRSLAISLVMLVGSFVLLYYFSTHA
ncbi:hypothetical protein PY650_17195 [Rhizobium calliandrae]|uniref:Uncharacterized protein n=1 Tax=Rhizobium calliandrae TaxID=1312182 RepID=A0ABT7KFJ7_9HYPH|nr:hypothetical protein [Rhizobium calliandrae]MDL2407368.1 hypothetical protein [Rhizobium calliandrae]